MSEMNKELLKANIRRLLEERGVTQAELAEITGMSQPNVSKALNPKDKKCFTVNQLFSIAQHYGVSIDELVGNKAPNEFATSPRAALAFITKLLCESKLRHTMVEAEEWVYEYEYTGNDYPECKSQKKTIEYPAFYFASYQHFEDFARANILDEDIHYDFMSGGNDSKFKCVNDILKNFLPMIKLYRETEIPDEAFQMVLNGYLEQLPEK